VTLAAWKIDVAGGRPSRLPPGVVELERNLEDWIESDPALIDPGLLVVRRQMHVEGGILDLLCVDLQGRLTVIEIKRGRLIRQTIAQAIDYASLIASMPEEALLEQVLKNVPVGGHDHPGLAALRHVTAGAEREVAAVVVGIGREPGLERIIDFLGSRFGFPIRAVTFDVFDAGEGLKVLVREETEPESVVQPITASSSSVAGVVEAAGGPESGNGRRLLKLAGAAEEAGLYVRPYKWSLMFTPMTKKTRYLMTVWKWADKDELALSYSSAAFAEFFPIDAGRVSELFGLPEGRHSIRSDSDADAWAERIKKLFEEINLPHAENDEIEPPGPLA
jgi:hypothetical protein